MTTELAQRDGIWYRPETADIQAIRDVNRMFTRPGIPEPLDVVLDLGAHIGAFTHRALAAGAAAVKAVEPAPDNVQMFHRNVQDSRVELVEAAVCGDNLIGQATLHLNTSIGTDSHSIRRVARGGVSVQVPTVSLAELCAGFDPTYIKIDIEGAEYDLELIEEFPDSADHLFIEFHFHKKGDRDRALALRERITTDLGFELLWESGWTRAAWWVEGMFQR